MEILNTGIHIYYANENKAAGRHNSKSSLSLSTHPVMYH